MSISAQIAKQLREVYFGGSWTASSLKEHLSGISRQQAVTRVNSFNCIAALTYHIDYYVTVAIAVLRAEPFIANDSDSFGPPRGMVDDWDTIDWYWDILVAKAWENAETLASLIEIMPDSKLTEFFIEEKYGTYYHNLAGIIEHAHYHLGQIVLIKRLTATNG